MRKGKPMNVYDELKARGFVEQCSHEDDLRKALAKPGVTYYIGFDPTADSLHVGSSIPLMAMAHLQRAGHRPIAIMGGATALIGDPSGKTETRRMMTSEEIAENAKGILPQMERFLVLDGKKGLVVNNLDWLRDYRYIDFLRDIGRYFRVNEMIKAEGYRLRLEREEGLSFIEFNYQLLQAYDFLILYDQYGCTLQMGGNDQWGNIMAGLDLVRRMRGLREEKKGARQKSLVFGLTFPLLETESGLKMGKTEKGTVWLDAGRTSPYELYQYWVNMDDADIPRFLRMFTFLSLDEIEELDRLEGADIRQAKEILAFEATKIAHGEDAAREAREASKAAFGGGDAGSANLPTVTIPRKRFEEGVGVVDLFVECGLALSKSDARRLISQKGAYLNDEPVTDPELVVGVDAFRDGALVLRRGRKQYCRVTVL